MLSRSARMQRGFTLIELLAVMAIIAVLAAIVAPAVSGTKNTSTDAQAAQDGLQVRTSATSYFKDQTAIEGVTKVATSTLGVAVALNSETYTGTNATTSTSTLQTISSRWPEKFITSSATSSNSIYYVEFNPSGTTTGVEIATVYVVDKDGKTIAADTLFGKYTAVDISALITGGYQETKPGTADSTITLGSTVVHQFIWLFRKSTSPGSVTVDNREVTIFKLETTEKNTTTNKYTIKYKQIF